MLCVYQFCRAKGLLVLIVPNLDFSYHIIALTIEIKAEKVNFSYHIYHWLNEFNIGLLLLSKKMSHNFKRLAFGEVRSIIKKKKKLKCTFGPYFWSKLQSILFSCKFGHINYLKVLHFGL